MPNVRKKDNLPVPTPDENDFMNCYVTLSKTDFSRSSFGLVSKKYNRQGCKGHESAASFLYHK